MRLDKMVKLKCSVYPYKLKRGERVLVPGGAGNFSRYLPNKRIEVKRFGGIKENYKASEVEPMYAKLSKMKKVKKCFKK